MCVCERERERERERKRKREREKERDVERVFIIDFSSINSQLTKEPHVVS